MNTETVIPGGVELDLSQLHTDGAPVPDEMAETPVLATVQGRVTYAPRRPFVPPPQFTITDGDAKRAITEGLAESLRVISQLDEPHRTSQLQALVRGASLTGYVTTARDQRVDSVDGLRALIYAIHRMTTAKVFDRGNKHLFFFAVPRGWFAYAGDVKTDSLVKFYQKKDQRMLDEWQKQLAAVPPGTPPPVEPPQVKLTRVPGTGSEHGPWVTLLRSGTHPDFILMPVIGPNGVQMEYKPVLINVNAPLHRARTLTFVVDQNSHRLLAWQAGRYVSEMTPAQRMDRIILAGNLTTDEDLRQ